MMVSRILSGLLVGLLAVAPDLAAGKSAVLDACIRPFSDIDPRKSLLVSEVEVLENAFTLKDVLQTLARDSQEPGLTPLEIWQEWWDTQDVGPGLGLGAHCDDNGMDDSDPPRGSLNGFPVQCPRAERQEVDLVPFQEDNPDGAHYILIGLVNRFDLAPADGRNCGEYRAIFGRVSGQGGGSDGGIGGGIGGGVVVADGDGFPLPAGVSPLGTEDGMARQLSRAPITLGDPGPIDFGGGILGPFSTGSGTGQEEEGGQEGASEASGRNLVIFEAVLPNPNPGCGLDGCQAIAEFWEELSDASLSAAERGKRLRDFYLFGLPAADVPGAVRVAHLTKGTGQIRTNQFISPADPRVDRIWQLREFKLARICKRPLGSATCRLKVVPVMVKKNPFGELFGRTLQTQGPVFKAHFETQVGDLMVDDINTFDYMVPNVYNAGQSNAQGNENHYPNHLPTNPSSPFLVALQDALEDNESDATPVQLVRRAHVLSCGGCHNPPSQSVRPLFGEPQAGDGLGEGMFWERSNGFTHVHETQMDPDTDVDSFKLSPALKEIFLPHREEVFERYLSRRPCRACTAIYQPVAEEGQLEESEETVWVRGEEPLDISSEALQALDTVLKQGSTTKTVGGTSRVH